MDCPEIPIVDKDAFVSEVTAERRLLSATLEVTQRCNNICTHCYMDPAGREPDPDPPLEFLLELLGALREEECLFVALTGGEPLVRPDFPELYEAIKRRGFIPIVMTNGRLVTEEIADLLCQLPPKAVSVSIYGATAKTYEAVSRAPGSFEEAMAGIRRLRARDVNLEVKTMALRSNYHELDDMRAVAEELGVPFRYDTVLMPTIDGETHVLRERLEPETIVELDRRDPQRMRSLRESVERSRERPYNPHLFSCLAGEYGIYVAANGTVLPCSAGRAHAWPLDRAQLRESLRHIFHDELLPAVRQRVVGEYPCGKCRLRSVCGSCSALRELEMGSARLPSPFGCRVAKLRAEALGLEGLQPAADAS